MADDDVLERLRAHLEPLADGEVELDPETDLTAGLGMDSHRVMDLLLDIEDDFGITVPMNAVSEVRTAGELAEVIRDLVEER